MSGDTKLRWDKYEALKAYLVSLGSVAVAFSGGVDSTFLLQAAREALGERTIALTAVSPLCPEREQEEARVFCAEQGIRQIVIEPDVFAIEGFAENPKNRCYLCKKSLFSQMLSAAAKEGAGVLAEGSNADDTGDYRPGMMAIAELGVRSPLKEAGLTKAEIRALSRTLGLSTWDKPSFACLASRIPYGERITREKLGRVEQAEQFLREQGFRQLRVRMHGTLARIELLPQDIPRFMAEELRLRTDRRLKELGFAYVSLDLAGYRTGSMNETLTKEERQLVQSRQMAGRDRQNAEKS